MKNNFAQEYAREDAIRAAYNTAKETGNKAGIEKAKADMRSLNEEIGEKGDAYAFVYRLYQEMKEAGNEHIDLHDTIRDEAKMIETLRSLGVESFTFSSGSVLSVPSTKRIARFSLRTSPVAPHTGTSRMQIKGF